MMKVVGRGQVHIYRGVDECPHEPGKEELWQESFVIYFWDVERKVYAFMRLSQEPNRGPGYTTLWVNAWTPGYVYRHVDDSVPFAAGDRTETSLCSRGGHCRYEYDGNHNWSVQDGAEDFRLQLVLKDYHPGIGPYAEENVGSLVTEANKHHIEATGWATGSVSVKGKACQIAGTAWRDHSWGKRNWSNIRTHRFYPAMFGRDFNFFAITFVGADGNKVKAGAIIRNDTVEMTTDFDIVSYMGSDGVSNCGGRVTLQLGGKAHVMEFEPQTVCNVSVHRNFVVADTMCKVVMGDKTGVGVAETSTRPQGGEERPCISPPSIADNGSYSL